MKTALKLLLRLFLITLVIFIIAIVAAPFFIRQDQIKNFIQNKVELSEGSKLTIEGDIGFGIFPYSFVKIPKALITDNKGATTSIDNIEFGFNTASLMQKSVIFDIGLKIEPHEYSGHVEFKDYHNFLDRGESPIVISLEKPIKVDITAYFERVGDKVSLLNIKATHKQTQLAGSFQTVFSGTTQTIKIEGTIDTQNLDDLRKIYKLSDENDFSLFSGIGKINFDVTTSGVKSQDFISNLNGKGSANLTEATIYGVDFNQVIGAPQDVTIEKSYERKIEINKADATFKITNGIIVTEDLALSNDFATASAKGQSDLSRQLLAVNIDIDADLVAAKVNVPLTISGNFNDLKITARAGDALMNNANALGSKIRLNNLKLDKESITKSIERLKDIGKGLGLDIKTIKNEVLQGPAPSAPPADAGPAPAADQPAPAPAATPAPAQ